MKPLTTFVLALGFLIAANARQGARADEKADAIKKALKKLEGTWKVVSVEVDGKKRANAQGTGVFKGNTFTFRQKEQVVEGTFTIDPAKSPKTLDLTVTKGKFKGKKSLAIYELKGDTLKACWTLFAKPGKRPEKFETKDGSGLLLGVYKRQKK